MIVHLRALLVLSGLTGIHSISTVGKVSVKTGGSITIPCLYGSQYVNHVKYLCEGRSWPSCSYAVRTDQPNSRKFSISDDKNRRIFNVTINGVTNDDTDYWCAVEINGGADVREDFHLSVTSGTPSLYVDHQYITGFTGQNITINCHYRNRGEMAWCRLVGRSCVTWSSGSVDGMRVTISARVLNVFTVTMSDLRTESSGWYLCVKGDFQMPVHVTVNEQSITTTLATKRTLSTLSPTPDTVNLIPGLGNQAPISSSSVDLKSLIIPLSFLIIVMVTLSVWFLLKKRKQTKAASSAMTVAEEDITYCNIEHMRKAPSQRLYSETDVDVMYSSVVIRRQQSAHRVDANYENEAVTYSTLA